MSAARVPTPLETYRNHREACHVCRGNSPISGPMCAIGKQLRNLAIDDKSEPPAPLLARLESSNAQYTNSVGGFTGAIREVNGDMLVAAVHGATVDHLNARRAFIVLAVNSHTALLSQNAALREALLSYGRHDAGCEVNELVAPCHCGFRAALSSARGTGGGE